MKLSPSEYLIIKSFEPKDARRIFKLICEEMLGITVEKGLGIVRAWSIKNVTFHHVIKLCNKKLVKRRIYFAVEKRDSLSLSKRQGAVRKKLLLEEFSVDDMELYKPEDHLNLE